MTTNNPNSSSDTNGSETASNNMEPMSLQSSKLCATTPDQPEFGWSAYAERVNGRFAMIGFFALLVIEALNNQSFLQWAGILK